MLIISYDMLKGSALTRITLPDRAKEPLVKRKLYQDVMVRIVDLIRTEGYGVADYLPSERELMDYFGVGRPAVREALQNLHWMGLITINHGERAKIAEPSFSNLLGTMSLATNHILANSAKSLQELKDARLLFEGRMVRIAAEHAQLSDIAKLNDLVDAQERQVEDTSEFLRYDMLFHREIARMTGNGLYSALSEAMIGWLAEFYRDLVRAPGAEHVTLAEHREIIEALAANDPDAAERRMENHLTRASGLYQQTSGAGDTSQKVG